MKKLGNRTKLNHVAQRKTLIISLIISRLTKYTSGILLFWEQKKPWGKKHGAKFQNLLLNAYLYLCLTGMVSEQSN